MQTLHHPLTIPSNVAIICGCFAAARVLLVAMTAVAPAATMRIGPSPAALADTPWLWRMLGRNGTGGDALSPSPPVKRTVAVVVPAAIAVVLADEASTSGTAACCADAPADGGVAAGGGDATVEDNE